MSSITSITTHFLADLPGELTAAILLKLDVQSLGRFCQVSSEANRLAGDDRLWKGCVGDAPIPLSRIKAFIGNHAVTSQEEAIARLRKFTQKITLNDSGQFTCYFLRNPGCHVTAKLTRLNAEKEFHEVAIFTRKLFDDKALFPSQHTYSEVVRTYSCKIMLPKDEKNTQKLAWIISFLLQDRIDTIKARNYQCMRCKENLKIALFVGAVVFIVHVFKFV